MTWGVGAIGPLEVPDFNASRSIQCFKRNACVSLDFPPQAVLFSLVFFVLHGFGASNPPPFSDPPNSRPTRTAGMSSEKRGPGPAEPTSELGTLGSLGTLSVPKNRFQTTLRPCAVELWSLLGAGGVRSRVACACFHRWFRSVCFLGGVRGGPGSLGRQDQLGERGG